jgi:uncharacterized membrane protein
MAGAVILAATYVVIGQFVRFFGNPMVPGANIALNMVVVVIAGILLGPAAGALVGLVGTAVNGFLTPAGNPFEQAALLPHGIMGAAAGLAARRSVFTGALTITVGHGLNVLVFLTRHLMPATAVTSALFFSGLLFEIVVDVVVVLFAIPLLRPLMRSPAR